MSGLILSAPSSGAGKTTITLGILAALRREGLSVRAAKSGPDYIDPRFHEAACGVPCVNLDAWAMTPDRIRALASGPGTLIVEGAMGLFDGAPPDGKGATADLARILGLPVVLIVNAGHMAQSVAPLVAGFARHDAAVRIAGIILNRVGSDRHAAMLKRALEPLGIPVIGTVRRDAGLEHPSRHLGLLQAQERPDIDTFIARAADLAAAQIDLSALMQIAAQGDGIPEYSASTTHPPAQEIAIAQDAAFAFAYPHLLNDWHRAGATLRFFSPLADDAVPKSELVILPGGYPELHAGRIAAASNFMQSLMIASQSSDIYGECGGYMTMGDGLIDAQGQRHAMAGLLRLETSFATRRLHLGYRHVHAGTGRFAGNWTAHEFHYAATVRTEGEPLFTATDAEGTPLAPMGLRHGRASGSFAHLIDRS